MAPVKAKTQPIGSSQWIQSEREQASDFVRQEVEEFSYSARNEMEWLNEHMADVFSKTQINFADVFKTPGKLRGKTPRTAKKRDALATRQPLTDIFAPNSQAATASPQRPNIFEKIAQFEILSSIENQRPISRGKSPARAGVPCTDSGYHGMTEDEAENSLRRPSIDASSQGAGSQRAPLAELKFPPHLRDVKNDESGASDESFVSAEEQGGTQATEVATIPDVDMEDMPPLSRTTRLETEQSTRIADQNDVITTPLEVPVTNELVGEKEVEQTADVEMEDTEAVHSELSSPEKPLQRKSSFAFSALPAREPLGSKKSMGQFEANRSSILGKSYGAKIFDADHEGEDEHDLLTTIETKEHNKTSTQLLHERITMLGKTKDTRPSKSIPAVVSIEPLMYPQLPVHDFASQDMTLVNDSQKTESSQPAPLVVDDDDDWIAPSKSIQVKKEDLQPTVQSQPAQARPIYHQKSFSVTEMPSPRPQVVENMRQQKAFSQIIESTTPLGSPTSKRNNEGPLSASKNRLWSALKSAKNIFASSASASAAAKLEAHKNSPSWKKDAADSLKDASIFNMPGAMYSERDMLQSPSRPATAASHSPSRKTRSSTESDRRKEKDAKAQQKVTDDLEKAREKERQKAARQQEEERVKVEKAEAARLEREAREASAQLQRPFSADSERSDMAPPPPSKTGGMSLGKLRAPGRPLKPTKEATSTRPVPVSIRINSQAQRLGQGTTGSQSSLSKSQHDSLAPPPPPKDASSRTASAQSNRAGSAAPANNRLKALEAAARKKEADEKAAQKKVEQKRELERKRAAKAEEERRAEEERKAAEQQRAQEAKLAAQRKAEKQAADARKREQDRAEQQRLEQQKRDQEREDAHRRELERDEQQRRELEAFRQQEEARRARDAHDLAEAIRRERAQQSQNHPRGDVGGTLRQLVKATVPVHQNPAKPPKRQFNPDEDGSSQDSQRPPVQRGPPSYQQTDAKRRRTSEEPNEPKERHSVMAPPKRPSNWRKDTLSKLPQGYTHAPPPAQHHTNMFKSALAGQHQAQHGSKPGQPLHPSQLVQLSNARIPFADHGNPPAYAGSAQQQHGHHSAHSNKFKTPARPAPGFPKSAGKTNPNTPSYPAGDNIELPDIATDSEDEDSEDEGAGGAAGGFRAPSWVASPALRELLTQQQLVDPESVFGPIGELKMDEVFRNGKNQERLKRFRDRGSSAMWIESGDAVTSAEKRRDMEMRERVVRDGGWRYEPGA